MGEPDYQIPSTIEEELEKISGLEFAEFNKYIWKNYGKQLSYWSILRLLLLWALSLILFSICIIIIRIGGSYITLHSIVMFVTSTVLVGMACVVYTLRRFDYSRQFIKTAKRIFPGVFIVFGIIMTVGAIVLSLFQIEFFNFALIASISYFSAGIFTLVLITTHPHLHGAGILRSSSLLLLQSVLNEEKIVPFIKLNINSLYEGWDQWLAEGLKLRVKNYTTLRKSLLNPLLFSTEELLQKVKDILTQDFFDCLRDWQRWDSPLKISVAIKSLSTEEPDIVPDSLIFKIKPFSSFLVAIISGALGWITTILAIFQMI